MFLEVNLKTQKMFTKKIIIKVDERRSEIVER